MQPNILSNAEIEILNTIVRRLSKQKSSSVSLARLLERWNRLVSEVEVGYTDSIYDYINDVYIRVVLEEVLQEAPLSIRGNLLKIIEPLDNRFTLATEEPKHPLTKGLIEDIRWNRIPKKLGKELEDDLRQDGII